MFSARRWLAIAGIWTTTAWGNPATFAPPNDLYKEDNLFAPSAVSEEAFNRILDHAGDVFKPLFRSLGKFLVVQRFWNDSTVNAYAQQGPGQQRIITFFGGLARRPEITEDGFAMVVCHELGHHLGGYPFVSEWAAAEGQADYYAPMGCGRLLWRNDLAINAAARDQVPDRPKAMCDGTWTTTEDQNLCYRIMLAVKSTADFLAAMSETTVNFDTPDMNEATSTKKLHPAPQCRLDTMMASAACPKAFDHTDIPGLDRGVLRNSKWAEEDSGEFTCNVWQGHVENVRPRCWFKPRLSAAP